MTDKITDLKIECNDCHEKYTVSPALIVGNSAFYSSKADHCIRCDGMNLSIVSFLHPEDVNIDTERLP